MTMSENKAGPSRPLEEGELEALFAAARDEAPQPSPDLLARIVRDADNELAARSRLLSETNAQNGGSLRALLASVLGGWPALAGLSAAAVAGLAIGLGAPAAVETVTGTVIAAQETGEAGWALDELMSPWSGYEMLWEEG